MTPASRTLLSRRTALAAAGGIAALPFAAPLAAQAVPAPAKGGKNKPDVEALLSNLSLEQKIGQMFVAVGYGSRIDQAHKSNTSTTGVDTIGEIIRTHHVGGLIYFAWSENLNDVKQVATLSRDAQEEAFNSSGIPLLISTDEERGAVTRLPAPATALPGAMGLGATGSVAHARKAGRIIADELLACGINQAFAPDADVNVEAQNPVIGVRSFGADPQAVSRLAASHVKGLQKAGCSATVKHFPGHGDTSVDSHVGLPVIEHTREEIDELDLPPFIAAIDEGVDAIMTAHIVVPALDESERPATLSRPILTGLLREELGYDGVIVTDSLAMEGVRTMFDDARVPVEAILAGADQMLMPPDLAVAIGGVRDAVASGEISEERIDESVRRILTQKVNRGLFDGEPLPPAEVPDQVGTFQHRKAALKMADDAVTLITHDGDALPLRAGSSVLVTGSATQAALDVVVEELQALGVAAVPILVAADDTDAAQEAVAAADEVDAVLALTMSAGFQTPAAQVKLVKDLVATGMPVIHAALRNPYDVVQVGPVDASLAVYAHAECSMRALARAVTGEIRTKGTLPVAIPNADGTGEAFPLGHGLR